MSEDKLIILIYNLLLAARSGGLASQRADLIYAELVKHCSQGDAEHRRRLLLACRGLVAE